MSLRRTGPGSGVPKIHEQKQRIHVMPPKLRSHIDDRRIDTDGRMGQEGRNFQLTLESNAVKFRTIRDAIIMVTSLLSFNISQAARARPALRVRARAIKFRIIRAYLLTRWPAGWVKCHTTTEHDKHLYMMDKIGVEKYQQSLIQFGWA